MTLKKLNTYIVNIGWAIVCIMAMTWAIQNGISWWRLIIAELILGVFYFGGYEILFGMDDEAADDLNI